MFKSYHIPAYGRLTVVKKCSVSQCSPSDQNSWVRILFRFNCLEILWRCSCSFRCKWTNARQSRTKTPIFALPVVGNASARPQKYLVFLLIFLKKYIFLFHFYKKIIFWASSVRLLSIYQYLWDRELSYDFLVFLLCKRNEGEGGKIWGITLPRG